MSDTFRLLIDSATSHGWCDGGWGAGAGDAVLAMPEMDAIRQALDGMARSLAYECNDDVNHADADGRFTHPDRHSSLRECWLAEFMPDGMDHVIAWVLGHE